VCQEEDEAVLMPPSRGPFIKQGALQKLSKLGSSVCALSRNQATRTERGIQQIEREREREREREDRYIDRERHSDRG
jgi:hypothetical protein